MVDTLHTPAFTFTARVLGGLFWFPPQSEQAQGLIAAFRNGEWEAQWPSSSAELASLTPLFAADAPETIPQAWQRLFIGPSALPAPPWGSVWLDKENVLFGESTLALRQWMRHHHIVQEMQHDAPEDHFGALMLLAAWLVENDRASACDELLAWHLLPWAGRFLDVLESEAGHPFWHAAARLARLTLVDWQTRLLMPVAPKKLYR